jgi:hypothetical protein
LCRETLLLKTACRRGLFYCRQRSAERQHNAHAAKPRAKPKKTLLRKNRIKSGNFALDTHSRLIEAADGQRWSHFVLSASVSTLTTSGVMPASLLGLGGTTEEAAEKLNKASKSSPQALKRNTFSTTQRHE